jgi:peptide/nickel transport system ATP-binding protein/oligopeptide transport system ATP-binding protein
MTGTSEHPPLLEVIGLKKYFESKPGPIERLFGLETEATVKAVNDVSFTLRRGEVLGIVGESGCGKSTLGKTIVKLLEPTDGKIRYEGRDIVRWDDQRRELRKRIQIVFQEPGAVLNPRMTVERLVAEPVENYTDLSGAALTERVNELLRQVDLPVEMKDRYPHELSGGQSQRVVIARALAPEPDLLIADEPVTGLDVSVQSKILTMLETICAREDIGMVFISHDISVVKYISDRVAVMYLGKIVEEGRTDAVFESPQHPYTRELKRAIPKAHPDESGESSAITDSEVPSAMDPPSGCPFNPRCPLAVKGCDRIEPSPVVLEDGRKIRCHLFEHDDGTMTDAELERRASAVEPVTEATSGSRVTTE